jgi:hypothetical protein
MASLVNQVVASKHHPRVTLFALRKGVLRQGFDTNIPGAARRCVAVLVFANTED